MTTSAPRKNFGSLAIIWIDALLFGAFGVLYLLNPTGMAAKVGIQLTSAGALVDVQGLYGGLEIGLALFLILSSRKNLRLALTAATLILGSIAVTRLWAMSRIGVPESSVVSLVAMDCFGALVNGIALWRFQEG